MESSLVLSAWVMGLVGGPHCVAMCGAACAGIAKAGEPHAAWALWKFQFSRLLGYSLMGALAGGTVQGLGWMGAQTPVLRPLWTMVHVAALMMGAWLVWTARQPAFLDGWGQTIWRKFRPLMVSMGQKAPVVLGVGWALMPCGLLYSALLVASLSANAWQGGAIMAAFAAGSTLSLVSAPWLLLQLKNARSGGWGIRLAGAGLVATSGWALWLGITQPSGLWCA
ncbi:MAG: hypothetical protein RI959_907 [Pseudomonadota bacterium]|jgi:sulfite exporter TauE/SafE